jgi:hypothetical protein
MVFPRRHFLGVHPVQKAVTPRGVEHYPPEMGGGPMWEVQKAVTPRGVEHSEHSLDFPSRPVCRRQ